MARSLKEGLQEGWPTYHAGSGRQQATAPQFGPYKHAMIRPIAIVSAGTLGSRLAGFVRDALIAALFGAGFVADAFLFAFQFVNVARRLLSEGALNAVLVPAYLRHERDRGTAAAAAFAGRALGTIGIAVLALALLLARSHPYAVAPAGARLRRAAGVSARRR